MAGHYWSFWQAGNFFPPNAVRGGTDIDGTAIYVGKAYHDGDTLPAKVIPEKSVAYVPFNGEEVTLHSAEVLCESTLKWVSSNNGNIPPGAIQGGQTSSGEPLYVGRVWHEGVHTVGKIHPSHGCCYIPFGGNEISQPYYEVLVASNE